jgi:serine phosphatase RsbU (regulator of sigma subunit)
MAGSTRVTFDSAYSAADAVNQAGTDCVEAREASQTNTNRVVAGIEDVEGSRAAVEQFMSDLRADLTTADTTVQSSDWESVSKDRFAQHVNELRTAMDRSQAEFEAEYEAAMNALAQLKVSVEELHASFSGATINAEADFQSSSRIGHEHIGQVEDLSNNGIR